MSNISLQRIKKEIKEVTTSDEVVSSGIRIELISDDNFYKMKGEIRGPRDTPYKDGRFFLTIDIPNNYPFQPPKVSFQLDTIKFTTKLWHPNISSATGVICLDVLKDQWAAAMTLRTVLLSIQSLLCDPQPNDPQDAVVANQYLSNIELFKKTALYWAQHFAKAPGTLDADFRQRVRKLVEMGVDPDNAVVTLSHVEWDVTRATERVFSN